MHAEQTRGYTEAAEIQYKETNEGTGIPSKEGGIDDQKRKTRLKRGVM